MKKLEVKLVFSLHAYVLTFLRSYVLTFLRVILFNNSIDAILDNVTMAIVIIDFASSVLTLKMESKTGT